MHGICGTARFLNPRNLSGSCGTIAWLNRRNLSGTCGTSGLVEPKEPVRNLCGTCVEPVWNLWNHCVFEPKECLEPVEPHAFNWFHRFQKFLGFKKCKGSRAQVPPVPPPSVPDFRGREMLHQVQAQRLKPNCMAVGNLNLKTSQAEKNLDQEPH